MNLIRFAVQRPVTTAMFYSAVVLLGLISLGLLPRELFPTITYPELLVVTRYSAAAPEELESIITKVIEEQVSTVPNLKRVKSISREGVSIVVLQFNWGTNMADARLDVIEKRDRIKERLPQESEDPVIQVHNPFAQPMMVLSVSGDYSLSELTRISNDIIKKRLQKVKGVGSAAVSGGQEREILVEVDLFRMQASRISISGIVDSLKTSNVDYPAGTTQGRFYEYMVKTEGEYKDLDDIRNTVIAVDEARDSPKSQLRSYGRKKSHKSFQSRESRLVLLGQPCGTFLNNIERFFCFLGI